MWSPCVCAVVLRADTLRFILVYLSLDVIARTSNVGLSSAEVQAYTFREHSLSKTELDSYSLQACMRTCTAEQWRRAAFPPSLMYGFGHTLWVTSSTRGKRACHLCVQGVPRTALIKSFPDELVISSHSPWLTDRVSLSVDEAEGTSVKLHGLQIVLLKEALDMFHAPICASSRPLDSNFIAVLPGRFGHRFKAAPEPLE